MKFSVRSAMKFKRVMEAQEKAKDRLLTRSGAYIRRIARDFVRHRRNPEEHSKPLHSPYDHFGLKNSIIFATDSNAAYVGPRYVSGGLSNVARLHEFGGTRNVRSVDGRLMDGVSIGDEAPVTEYHASRKDRIIRRESRRDDKTGRRVVWIRIRTKSQAQHASRLYRRFAPLVAKTKTIRYPPRPYMHPALMKSLPHLSEMWRGAIRN